MGGGQSIVKRSLIDELLLHWKCIDGMAQALCQEIWAEVTAFGDMYQTEPQPASFDDIKLSYLCQQLAD